jgi:hypothetical protein
MKLRLQIVLFFSFTITTFAQVGIGTTAPNASSELDIVSTTRGVLIPRMTQAQRVAIATPATGLLVYQIAASPVVITDTAPGFYYFNGTVWIQNTSPLWSLTGNSGTLPATDYIGTRDSQPLIIKTNAVERMRILPTSGFIGIGTSTPTAKLHLVTSGGIIVSNDFEGATIAPFVNTVPTPNINGGAWSIQTTNFTTGAKGAQSGNGVPGASAAVPSLSQMDYVVTVPVGGATLTFDYKVSSEATWDFFRFYVDTFTTASALVSVSGNVGWATATIPITAGAHTLRWVYSKDNTTNSGDDRAYIDNVVLSNPSPALRIVDGNQALGKVLTSDALGQATWATPTISGSNVWLLSGNVGTNSTTNFVGTTDAQNFTIRTNNQPRINVLTNGNVGIGVTVPTAKLDVSENLVGQGIIKGTNTNSSDNTISYGILGEANATGIGSAGVVGFSNNTGTGINEIGVLGDYTLWGAAVYGQGRGAVIANDLLAATSPVNLRRDYGVYGSVGSPTLPGDPTPPPGVGVYGKNGSTSAGSFGMYCNGNFAVTGTKSASVPTTQGNQLVYCTESPELWFEDLGFGTLVNGSTHIALDDMFLETIYIDASKKMHVFLQEEGDSNGLFVVIDSNNKGFTVKEKNNGRSNNSFSYRILAKRRFYQDQRFGVDANQPFENNLIKHKDVPVTTTDPQEMKRLVEDAISEKERKFAETNKK